MTASRIFSILIIIVASIFAFCGLIWLMGSSNPYTPAGYAGYVTQGAVFGEAKYLGYQLGPKSYSRTWLAKVINVPITTATYEEFFTKDHSVLSKDDLKIEFNVHTVMRVKSDEASIRLLVEKFAPEMKGVDPARSAYNSYLTQPIRNAARDKIQSLEALQIKDHINDIGDKLTSKAREMSSNTPFDIVVVVVGNIQYPSVVSDAVAEKLAASQIMQKKEVEIKQVEMDAIKRVKEAEGIASAMKIINSQLSSAYLQHEAIEAQKMMVNSPSHTTVYIPSGPMGVPLVGTFQAAPETKAQK